VTLNSRPAAIGNESNLLPLNYTYLALLTEHQSSVGGRSVNEAAQYIQINASWVVLPSSCDAQAITAEFRCIYGPAGGV